MWMTNWSKTYSGPNNRKIVRAGGGFLAPLGYIPPWLSMNPRKQGEQATERETA